MHGAPHILVLSNSRVKAAPSFSLFSTAVRFFIDQDLFVDTVVPPTTAQNKMDYD